MSSSDPNLLQEIFQETSRDGAVSISLLARKLGLKPATIQSKLRPLVRKGLLELRDDGRKIGIHPHFGWVVGIDLGGSHLHFALADFCGEILQESTEKIRPEAGPRPLIAQIKQGIRKLAGGAQKHGRLKSIALAVPSPVDPATGVVAFANNLPGWRNIDLRREMEKEFRVPIYLENDANMAAIGERWRGVARGVNNFVFIAIGTGIGSGIITDGRLYRGRTGSAGELFRMNLDWLRWTEDFGDSGFFENYVSGQGIAAEGRKALGSPVPSGSSDLAAERDAYFVFEAFRRGDPRASEVLEKIFTMLGVGVANLVAVLDPELIVVGGGVVKGASDFMLSIVEKVVRRIHGYSPALKVSSLGDKAQTHGAIFSALTVAQEALARRLR